MLSGDIFRLHSVYTSKTGCQCDIKVDDDFDKTDEFFDYMEKNKQLLNFKVKFIADSNSVYYYHEYSGEYEFKNSKKLNIHEFKIKSRVLNTRFCFSKSYFTDVILKNKDAFNTIYNDIIYELNSVLNGKKIIYKNLIFLSDYYNMNSDIYTKRILFSSAKFLD